MKDVYEYAKYFIKKGLDANQNTYDSNMKLQKLLFFAYLINLSNTGELLFDDDISAFENGCVIENVRLKYKNDYDKFINDSEKSVQNFTRQECKTLEDTIGIFGDLSARELSDLNHTFDFWKNAFNRSKVNGNYNKELSIIKTEDIKKELHKIKSILSGYEKSKKQYMKKEIINGIKFYYNPSEVEMNEETINKLYLFSKNAEDNAYTIYIDNGEMVIY